MVPGQAAGLTQPEKTRQPAIAVRVKARDLPRVRGTDRAVVPEWLPAEVPDVHRQQPPAEVPDVHRQQLPAEAVITDRVRHSLTPTKTEYATTFKLQSAQSKTLYWCTKHYIWYL